MTIVERKYWENQFVYCYDPDTKVFTYVLECQPHPVTPGLFLQPSSCTLEIPPQTGQYQKCVYTDNGWIIEDDYSSVDEAKLVKIAECDAAFANLFNIGFMSPSLNALVDIRRDAGHNDLQNYQSLHTYMVANNIETTLLRLTDNSFADPITQSQLNILIMEIIGYGLLMYQKKWDLESQINSCTTLEELALINW